MLNLFVTMLVATSCFSQECLPPISFEALHSSIITAEKHEGFSAVSMDDGLTFLHIYRHPNPHETPGSPWHLLWWTGMLSYLSSGDVTYECTHLDHCAGAEFSDQWRGQLTHNGGAMGIYASVLRSQYSSG